MTIDKILSIPKSLWVSLHFFSLKETLRLPILVRYNTKIVSLKGSVVHSGGGKNVYRLVIGFGDVGTYDKKCQRSMIEIDGTIVIPDGRTTIGQGSRLSVGKNAVLSFGKNFVNSAGMTIICTDSISFGDDVLVSWETLIMDSDWHSMRDTQTGEILQWQEPISIGDNVWICCRSTILKGSNVANGSVIAAGAVISGKYDTENVILGGVPAKIIKHNMTRNID